MSNPNTPVITLSDNQLRTLSTDVAAYFGKQHKDVLRQIRQIMANCTELFNERNFALVEIKDAKGEMRPSYSLTKDAFMLVVMGFTGHKAMQCKLAYIEEFNRMRSELSKPAAPAQPETPLNDHSPDTSLSCSTESHLEECDKLLIDCRHSIGDLSNVRIEISLYSEPGSRVEKIKQLLRSAA
ncbi:hypothetical protein C4J81_17105 [Deltaproteobacteria bacterium Smac51]|nr:hypothetical protein C4J81_17105 [Deltaproteobacteria bacterium Smac51]